MKIFAIFAAAFLAAAPVFAQLAPPNEAGVTMGHIHLNVRNVAEQQHFWELLGGTPVHNEKLNMIQFPSVFIILRQMEPADSATPSIVDHFGFVVKDMPGELAKWRAANLKVEQGQNPNQGYVTGPDGIRVEMFGDPSLPTRIQMNHIHFYPVDIPAMQAWYAKTFGGVPGKRARVARPGWIDCDDLPGVNLSFSQGEAGRAPTKGRLVDHIGFEVTNLAAFVKKLEAQGITLDEPIRPSQNSKRLKVVYLTDPWGTRIELTQGLAPSSN
jgi:catechol 2,3-dioxygenase-like lactoylglutathione lyase family enzyme